MIRRLFLALLLVVTPASPAAADDIAAAARGVARIVTIAVVDGHVAGFGHGSGIAVAPGRIVTNAHVVELADRYPDDVVIGVVPSEGSKSYRGRVVAYDPARDLALIEFRGAVLPPAAIFTGPVGEGDAVVALGYPGNVDLATARSAADYITPTAPVRSEGVFSARRRLDGTEVLLHTASIARGNSGGPLLDRCGRVIGVNSAITRAEDGDSTFGFAIADRELLAFLREAGQAVTTIAAPCTSIEERLRLDGEAEARARADASAARRDAASAAAASREASRARAAMIADRRREDVIGLAGLLLVAGAMAVGAAGFLDLRGRRRPARLSLVAGIVVMVGAIALFVARPGGGGAGAGRSASALLPASGAPSTDAPMPAGRLVCAFRPERSRVTVSPTSDVSLGWGDGGCRDGRSQYVDADGRWRRILVAARDQAVVVSAVDPAARTLTDTRYLLSAGATDALRRLGASSDDAACTRDPATIERLRLRQAAIRAALPPLPNEKLVYSCAAVR